MINPTIPTQPDQLPNPVPPQQFPETNPNPGLPSNPPSPGQLPDEDLSKYFHQTYGVSLEDAQARYNEAVLKSSLSEAWDISPKEAMKRLETVMTQIEKLPPEEQEKYNSIDGVVGFYNQLQANTNPPSPTNPVRPFQVVANQYNQPQTAKAPEQFTKDEIRSNPAAYQAAIYDQLVRDGEIKV
jgi:hypothetical protein